MATIIAAMDRNRLIGVDNGLPWRLSADLQNFKKLTSGHTIVMGRKTWESLPGKLPKRHHVIVTRNEDYQAAGCKVVNSIEQALNLNPDTETFIIGGGQIYEQSLDLVDKMILTEVDTEAKGDAWFPEFDSKKWELTSKESFEADEKNEHPYTFCYYQKL